MTLFLVDASHYQSALPVSGLRGQGFVALIAKATQGSNWQDGSFGDFMRQAQQAGLLFAAYHYLEVGSYGSQAANTASVVPRGVPVWIDVEGGTTRDQAYQYAGELQGRGLTVAGIYCASQPGSAFGWWRAAYGIDPTGSASYCYAANGGDASSRWDAGTTRHPQLWQFTQHGRVQGYPGDVDINAYKGTLQQLIDTGWFWVPDALKGVDVLTDEDKAWLQTLVPQPKYLELMVDLHTAAAVRNTVGAPIASILAAVAKLHDVDEAKLAGDLAPLLAQLLPGQVEHLSDADLEAIANAVSDEEARRLGGGS